jgi:hypothetical protein
MALSFTYPPFHFSIIPIFQSASIGKQNPFGVKSKPGALGQDSLLNAGMPGDRFFELYRQTHSRHFFEK